MNRSIYGGIAALALVVALLVLAMRSQRVLESNLPPRVECANRAEGFAGAQAFAEAIGGKIMPVLGTGSMAPYIPAAPAGANPLATTVACVVTRPGATYADVEPGSLCLWRVNGSIYPVLHLAAEKTSAGWKMAGLHNRHYDGPPMTEGAFLALVARVFVWPQPIPP